MYRTDFRHREGEGGDELREQRRHIHITMYETDSWRESALEYREPQLSCAL